MINRKRNRYASKPDCYHVCTVLSCKRALFCVLAMAASVMPLCAQRTRYTPNFGAAGRPPVSVVQNSTFDTNATVDEESCFPWRLLAARPAIVTVNKLKVPAKATGEYEKACDSSNKNKFKEAEQHARAAIDSFQGYSAAWVMLGVILQEQQRSQEAYDACLRAAGIDASYLPAYLCAAEISARSRQWEQVLDSADRALGLQSERGPYGYYYRAMAYLHMNNLAGAKKDALRAVEIDVNHDDPSLCFLLAVIYERDGDSANAITQLQQFLKHPSDRQREDVAKQLLAKLESQPSTK